MILSTVICDLVSNLDCDVVAGELHVPVLPRCRLTDRRHQWSRWFAVGDGGCMLRTRLLLIRDHWFRRGRCDAGPTNLALIFCQLIASITLFFNVGEAGKGIRLGIEKWQIVEIVICLTASGGPFLTLPMQEFFYNPHSRGQTSNWSMGQKISVDSATMMNKGLEVIEAHWLFG